MPLRFQDVMKTLQLFLALFCVYSRSRAQQPGTEKGSLASSRCKAATTGEMKNIFKCNK